MPGGTQMNADGRGCQTQERDDQLRLARLQVVVAKVPCLICAHPRSSAFADASDHALSAALKRVYRRVGLLFLTARKIAWRGPMKTHFLRARVRPV